MPEIRKKILIIDDDADLSMLIVDMLEDKGYDALVVGSISEGCAVMEREQVHLVLLDINLPDGTGFELCRELRPVSDVPVIFTSARTSEDDRITGLDMGGDDYISKPYSLKELMSRINSLLRRAYGFEKTGAAYSLKAGENNIISIETSSRSVKRNGEIIQLSQREYDLLLYLTENKGTALSKDVIFNSVWGAFSDAELSTLTVHIRWLREKLELNPSRPVFIKTVWGVGYMLEETA